MLESIVKSRFLECMPVFLSIGRIRKDLTMKEIWKPISGYENLYNISNLGNVFSIKSNRNIKPTKNYKGYLMVGLCKNKKRKNCLVHRLVAGAFIDNPNNLPEINHKDENPSNNVVFNLEWCTHKYNMNYNNLGKRIKIQKELNELYKQEDTILKVQNL